MNPEDPIADEDLQRFIDGRLPPERVAAVEARVAADPVEARRIARLRALSDDLRAALAPYAAEPVPPKLDLGRMIAARRRTRVAPWSSIAASLAMLLLGGAGGWILRSSTVTQLPQGLEALAQEAADSWRVFAPDRIQPVEFKADDRERLLRSVSNRIGRRAAIPDLAERGYRFMGGRVVATAHGAGGLYMYDDDHGTRIVLLVRTMDAGSAMPMKAEKGPASAGYAWARDGLGYSLMGPDAATGLHSLADDVRRQLGHAI